MESDGVAISRYAADFPMVTMTTKRYSSKLEKYHCTRSMAYKGHPSSDLQNLVIHRQRIWRRPWDRTWPTSTDPQSFWTWRSSCHAALPTSTASDSPWTSCHKRRGWRNSKLVRLINTCIFAVLLEKFSHISNMQVWICIELNQAEGGTFGYLDCDTIMINSWK